MSSVLPSPPVEMVPSSIPVSPPPQSRPPPPPPQMSLSPPPPPPTSTAADGVTSPVAPLAPPPVPKPVPQEPESAANDWQTGYCWAFIVRFHGDKLVGKNNLSTVMDLEYALMSEGHNEILSTVFQRFILVFRPAIKDINHRTMPKHLLRVIDHCLAFPSLSAYHPPSTSANAGTSLLLTSEKDEAERRALNPLRKLFEATREDGEPGEHSRGDGVNGEDNVGKRIWMMDWREKLKLLRQLVDWQLTHADSIRATIQEHYKMGHQKQTDFNPTSNPLVLMPIGTDRKKKRYWSFDASPRIYTSTNPYKKLCPLEPITSNKTELLQLVEDLRAPVAASVLDGYAATIAIGGPAAKKAKTARTQEEKGKAQEIEMAKWIEEEHLPRIEKEEQRLERARRKAEQNAIAIAQADIRTSRTRRSTRRPNYTNGGTAGYDDDDGNESSTSSTSYHSSRGAGTPDVGRRSARTTRDRDEDDGWEKIPEHLLREANGLGNGNGTETGNGTEEESASGAEDMEGVENGDGVEEGSEYGGDDLKVEGSVEDGSEEAGSGSEFDGKVGGEDE